MLKNKKNFFFAASILVLALIHLFSSLASAQVLREINPGQVWPDMDGNHIQAHGGSVIKVNNTYFWYGEERRRGLDSNKRFVSCYSSRDLMNWKFLGDPLELSDPQNLGKNWILERPKVFFNKKTKKYVMYFHLDNATYKFASVGIAVSDYPDHGFSFLKSFRPLERESRDIGQFVDDDGTAYLIFEDRPLGFHIAKLSDDFLDVVEDVCLISKHMEGGAIVHYDGLYYVIGSALTGWKANSNKYATAKSLRGPWSEFKDIAPPETNTYGSQSTFMLKIQGKKGTSVIFLGDIWKPKTQWDSRYLWMPLRINNGELWLEQPKSFTIDLKNGLTTFNDH